VNIGSRALDILIALITRPGELVTKRELMSIVWPDTVVVQANLTVNIVALRRALRDGQNGNRYIPNIPGRGYSFVAPVEFADEIKSSELPTGLRAADAVAIHASQLDFEPFGKFHPVNCLKGAPTRRARAHTSNPP
jgi:DNA-binding winged helix-turn-helix (wHTH) protein